MIQDYFFLLLLVLPFFPVEFLLKEESCSTILADSGSEANGAELIDGGDADGREFKLKSSIALAAAACLTALDASSLGII